MSQEASDLLVELGRLVWSMGAHLARTDECPPLPCCGHATDDLKEHCHYCQVRLTDMATVGEAGEVAVSENETGIPGAHGDRGSLAVGTVAVIQCLRPLANLFPSSSRKTGCFPRGRGGHVLLVRVERRVTDGLSVSVCVCG